MRSYLISQKLLQWSRCGWKLNKISLECNQIIRVRRKVHTNCIVNRDLVYTSYWPPTNLDHFSFHTFLRLRHKRHERGNPAFTYWATINFRQVSTNNEWAEPVNKRQVVWMLVLLSVQIKVTIDHRLKNVDLEISLKIYFVLYRKWKNG